MKKTDRPLHFVNAFQCFVKRMNGRAKKLAPMTNKPLEEVAN